MYESQIVQPNKIPLFVALQMMMAFPEDWLSVDVLEDLYRISIIYRLMMVITHKSLFFINCLVNALEL